jgi:purine-binding chemotaxis protein CheW
MNIGNINKLEGAGKEGLVQLVSFKIGDEEFGVQILKVQEIVRMMEITKVPKSPPFVEGIVNLRGRIIPVIDMRKRFNLPPKQRDRDTRIIVVGLEQGTVGFIVDAVSEVLRIPINTIESTPQLVLGVDTEYISGVGKLQDKLLIILDLDKILSVREKQMISGIREEG